MSDPLAQLVEEHRAEHHIEWQISPALKRQIALQKRRNYDKEMASYTLERLRYRQYERSGMLSDFMQRLGNWGRKYLPWVSGMRWWM